MGTHAETSPAAAGGPTSPPPEESIELVIWIVPENGQWTALAQDFDVVGLGPTQEAAVANMDELLSDYLMLNWRDGMSLEQARRPISASRRLRLQARLAVESVLKRVQSEARIHRVPHEAHC